MTTVEVFDPPMCCSTGVCGPSVDPALAAFAADLKWAGENGASVARYNLSQEPGRFAGHGEVRALLAEGGEGVLPVVVVEGEVRSSGRYPDRAELAAWALPGVDVPAAGDWPELPSGRITELTLIEAAAAPCCGGEEAGEASAGVSAAGQAGCCG